MRSSQCQSDPIEHPVPNIQKCVPLYTSQTMIETISLKSVNNDEQKMKREGSKERKKKSKKEKK